MLLKWTSVTKEIILWHRKCSCLQSTIQKTNYAATNWSIYRSLVDIVNYHKCANCPPSNYLNNFVSALTFKPPPRIHLLGFLLFLIMGPNNTPPIGNNLVLKVEIWELVFLLCSSSQVAPSLPPDCHCTKIICCTVSPSFSTSLLSKIYSAKLLCPCTCSSESSSKSTCCVPTTTSTGIHEKLVE